MSDPDYRRYAGVTSRAGDGLGDRGPQGFPEQPVPMGDPTRWGGRIEQPIVIPALGAATLESSQPLRIQREDAYASLWQLFGVMSATALAWQNMGKTGNWRSALLLLTFGAGQNSVEVAYDIFTGVAQLCGAYPFQGPGTPFQGRQSGDLIACPFYYPPFSPLIPANAVAARLQTQWAAGETEFDSYVALDLLAAPYAIGTGA